MTCAPFTQTDPIDYTKNGKCSRCGECCTHHLMMSEKEKQTIRKYVRKHKIKPCHHNAQGTSVDLMCPFLDTSKPQAKCLIYPVRPLVCQLFICCKTKQQFMFDVIKHIQHTSSKIKEYSKAKDIPLGTTFFPDEYLPKAEDLVVFNMTDRNAYEKYANHIFKVLFVMNNHKTVLLQDTTTDEKITARSDILTVVRTSKN